MRNTQTCYDFPNLDHIFGECQSSNKEKQVVKGVKKIIRRYVPKTSSSQKKLDKNKKLRRKQQKCFINSQRNSFPLQEEFQQKSTISIDLNSIQQLIGQEENELSQLKKIKFNPEKLPANLLADYISKKQLSNTQLIISGVKFVPQLALIKVFKWQKAIIIYQTSLNQGKNHHFGLLVKYHDRLISYDGIQKLWLIPNAIKSYHWAPQQNSWACGYIAMFWALEILKIGIDRWVQELEP